MSSDKADRSASTLDGVTALVTGGSRGIGRAIAAAFLAAGARVVITGRRSEGLDDARRSLGVGEDRLLTVAAHSARPEDTARVFDAAEESFGVLSVVVNNAATNPTMAPLSEVDLEVFRKTLQTNAEGYLLTAQEGAMRMRKAGAGGSIINVSSVAARRAWPGLGAYGVSKAAVDAITRGLAAELGRDGIRVNGVAPGLIRTRFSEALWKDPKAEERTARRLPLGRIGEPDDLGGVAVYLASGASRYVTGQTFVVDGGMLAV